MQTAQRKTTPPPPSLASGAMSLDEAADYLRISRSGVYRLLRSGRLKSARIGGRHLVRRSDVDDLLDSAIQGE